MVEHRGIQNFVHSALGISYYENKYLIYRYDKNDAYFIGKVMNNDIYNLDNDDILELKAVIL